MHDAQQASSPNMLLHDMLYLVALLHPAVHSNTDPPRGLVKRKGRCRGGHHPAPHGPGGGQKLLVRHLGIQSTLKRMALVSRVCHLAAIKY